MNIFNIMTPYEWSRVLINFGQLLAMIVIPFIILKKKINLTVSESNENDNEDVHYRKNSR